MNHVEQDLKDSVEAVKKDARWMLAAAGAILGTSLGGVVGTIVGLVAGAVVNRILWKK